MAINVAAGLAIMVVMLLMTPDDRVIAAPMLAVTEILLLFVSVLWVRDGVLPVFEVGALCVLATAVYGVCALLGFVMMHGEWNRYADNRLFAYPFVPREIGLFGWRYVVYTVSLAVTYLLIRRRAAVPGTAFERPRAAALAAVGIVFAALYLFKLALIVGYGYDTDVPYTQNEEMGQALVRMPYLLQQIGLNLLAALLVTQQAIIACLLACWRRWACRLALVTWLGFEVVSGVRVLGSRTILVLLLISAGMLYHRLVKPWGVPALALGGTLLLAGFIAWGVVRNMQSAVQAEHIENVFGTTNEFQALFVTAFDLHQRMETGTVRVPWQIYASDAYLLIPSQLLQIEKIEPASWYIDVIGETGMGVGYMFGVMSQAVVGFGWVELLLRGVVLGACLAILHRWYVSRSAHLWPTVFYVFVSVWTYYTFRATTFWIVYFVVYRFLPVMLAAKLVERLLSSHRPRRVRVRAQTA